MIIIRRIFDLYDEKNKITNSFMYFILICYVIILLLFGICMDSPKNIIYGLYQIIISPDFLVTDYIGIGGIGATFVNAGLITAIAIYFLYMLKVNINGAAVSTIFIMSGFSLFGKNLLNIWFIIIGVYLYAKWQRDNLKKYIYIALLGTSLGPIITQIMFGIEVNRIISIPLAIIIGIGLGFILPPLSSYLMRVHQGFNLYNIGFTSGMIATILVSILRAFGLDIKARLIWTKGNNMVLGLFLLILFSLMLLLGFILNRKSFKGLKKIFSYSGRLIADFIILEGFPVALMNMAISGLFALAYVIIIKGDLNGPTIGGILAISGFSAFGKHIKNVIPIWIGVLIGDILGIWCINEPLIILSALFGTTLSPISGEFGFKYGIVAGFILTAVALNVGYLHGGLNLYNGGFAGGILAAVMVPIIEAFRKDE